MSYKWNRPRLIRITFFFAIAIMLAVTALIWNQKKGNESVLTSRINIKNKTPQFEPNKLNPIITEAVANKPLYEQKHACAPIMTDAVKIKREWREHMSEHIQNHISDFDLDTAAKALTLLEDSFYAYRMKMGFQSKNSEGADRQNKFNKLINNYLGDDKPNISFGLSITEEVLVELFKLSPEDRSEQLLKVGLVIDDIFTAMKSEKIPNNQVIELMALLPNINGLAHKVANFQPEDLLDGIVAYGDAELLVAYRDMGGEIKNKEFGVNALERLASRRNPKDIPLDMLEILAAHLPVRIKEPEPNINQIQLTQIQLTKLGAHWDISVQAFPETKKLLHEYSVNLVQAPDIESLKQDIEVTDTLKQLSDYKKQYYSEALPNVSLSDLDACEEVNHKVHQALNHNTNKHQSILRETVAQYEDNDSEARQYLDSIDPTLTDCFAKNYVTANKRTRYEEFENSRAIYHLAYNNNLEEAIKQFKALNPSVNQKAHFFWSVGSHEPGNIAKLIEHKIKPQADDFFWASQMDFKSFSEMADLGFTFDRPSPEGKSLVFHASRQCNAELVQELHRRQHPYQYEDSGADALAYAITTNSCRTPTKRADLISAVMQFKPSLKPYHKQKIAALRLNDFASYKLLINRFPEMEVSNDLPPLPTSICLLQ